jgi:signal transduction histidine kinase
VSQALLRVLVVDDEEAHAEALRRSLVTRYPEIEVRICATLASFRQAAAEQVPDIALVDLLLPDGQAVDVLAEGEETHPFPIVVMTSHGDEQTAVAAIKAGAVDYVVKSAEMFAEMPHAVERALREWLLRLERQRAEEELRQSREHLQLALDVAELGTWRYDAIRGRIEADERARAQHGLVSAGTVSPRDLIERVFPEDRARLERAVSATLEPTQSAGRHAFEYRVTAPGGGVRWLSTAAQTSYEAEGEGRHVSMVVGTSLDVTRPRLAEEQLREAQKLAALGAVVAGLAHEVRNPLFAVSAVLDALDARVGPRADIAGHLARLREQIARMAELMNELLEYGRPYSPRMSEQAIGRLVARAASSCRRLLERQGVTLETQLGEPLPSVRADAGRLVQVFENVIENAAFYSPPGSLVRVDCRQVGQGAARQVECVVRDSGPGVAPEDLPRVFEPFYSKRSGGSGLGLAVAHRIVKEHDGTITVENAPEGGAVVTITLPA